MRACSLILLSLVFFRQALLSVQSCRCSDVSLMKHPLFGARKAACAPTADAVLLPLTFHFDLASSRLNHES